MGSPTFRACARSLTWVGAAVSVLGAADTVPPALQKMAETERAFAKRAAESTVREAFIEFFADEAVSFEPDPGPARERLRASARPQPPGFQLLWEPRLGDVAESGDLGFLTGPAEYILPTQPTRYTNYFSVWKRQPNGDFRVILDVGIATPQKAAFAPGLTRAGTAAAPRKPRPTELTPIDGDLALADKKVADEMAARGPCAAYASALHPNARVMRTGVMPMTSKDAAVAWFDTEVASMSAEPLKAETAASGELGYTWGRFSIKTTKGADHTGYYIRVWTRQADGAWRIAADVTTK